jgi:hypothetical protein
VIYNNGGFREIDGCGIYSGGFLSMFTVITFSVNFTFISFFSEIAIKSWRQTSSEFRSRHHPDLFEALHCTLQL